MLHIVLQKRSNSVCFNKGKRFFEIRIQESKKEKPGFLNLYLANLGLLLKQVLTYGIACLQLHLPWFST